MDSSSELDDASINEQLPNVVGHGDAFIFAVGEELFFIRVSDTDAEQ